MKNKHKTGQIILNLLFILLCLCFLIPFIYAISISLSDEGTLIREGYSLFPKKISAEAYRMTFRNPTQLMQSYKITILFSIVATVFAMLVMSMLAYAISRDNCKFRKQLVVFVLITMLFNAGMVPNYLLITKYLNLSNNILVYILPGAVSAWNLIILRTNFKAIPFSLIEAAKLDGASETYICFRIVMPLSLSTISAIAFLFLVPKWNDWYTSLLYIDDPKMYSLQFVLQRILRETEFLKQMAQTGQEKVDISQIPTESFKYAMALVVAGPMLLVFPFFQKYFVKGMTVGSVKE